MTLTIERPETEARVIRFASSRGLTPLEALDELLDRADRREATEAVLESFTEEGEDIAMDDAFAAVTLTVKGRS